MVVVFVDGGGLAVSVFWLDGGVGVLGDWVR